MKVDTADLERALDTLLTAMADDEARQPKAPSRRVVAKPVDLSGPVPTRADMELAQILRQPVYFACRLAVRRLGEQVFTITGSTNGMRKVADRVAGMAPTRAGRRLSMMDGAWDGLGSSADRWWS